MTLVLQRSPLVSEELLAIAFEQLLRDGKPLALAGEQQAVNLVSLFKVSDTCAKTVCRPAARLARTEIGKSESQASLRQLKTPAGRNDSVARKQEPAADQEDWKDF
jgi:hypothetical protein